MLSNCISPTRLARGFLVGCERRIGRQITHFFPATHCCRAFCPMNACSCRFDDIEIRLGVLFLHGSTQQPTPPFTKRLGIRQQVVRDLSLMAISTTLLQGGLAPSKTLLNVSNERNAWQVAFLCNQT